MIYVHQIVQRTKQKVVTRCGLMFNPKNKTGRLEVTLWEDNVTCPTCRTTTKKETTK